jgi:predicted transcriptional regulator
MEFSTLDQLKTELFKDPIVKKHYDELEVEFQILEDVIEKRWEKKITQAELAKRMGTKQSAISRFESGKYNPSLKFLEKMAKALDSKLEIRIR